jgi:hypothetical protein
MEWLGNYKLVTFTSRIKLHDKWAPVGEGRLVEDGLGILDILDAEVDDARDGPRRHFFTASALLGC